MKLLLQLIILSLFLSTISKAQYVQQGAKLVGTGLFGLGRVSISSDGNTAIVSAASVNPGPSALIYTRTGAVWSQQGPLLIGTGAIIDFSGSIPNVVGATSVAISEDGNTAIIGNINDNGSVGAAWVFTRSVGIWTQQGNKLVGNDAVGAARQGYSVSLSADGNTAIVGGAFDDTQQGAAWVYSRSGGIWSQQGNKLVGNDAAGAAFQGASVSLSGDGYTAVVGGPYNGSEKGAIWVYTRIGNTWSQEGGKLIGNNSIGNYVHQGKSVAISSNGNTVIVGGHGDGPALGAAWVFTRNGTIWSQQGDKLVGTGGSTNASQGSSVSISGDGNTAIVGGPNDNSGNGAAWMYYRLNNIWSQHGNKLIGTGSIGAARQGSSVALSADGTTTIVGGTEDNSIGAVWIYTLPTPIITSFTPTTATTGATVTITGTNLIGTTAVSFGGIAASFFTVVNATTITAKVASGANGSVSVTTPSGMATLAGFVYVQPLTLTSFTPTTANTGTTVNITGTNFTGTTSVSFGGIEALSFNVVSATSITAVVGNGANGSVSVTTAGIAATLPGFTYLSPINITSFSPSTGSVGTLVTITGTNLTNPTTFTIGGVPAIVVSNTSTKIVGMVMPGAVTGPIAIYIGGPGSSVGPFTVITTPYPSLQQGSKLVISGAIGAASQGSSVSVSADGNTAIVGGFYDNNNIGAAWVYTRSGGTWMQQGYKLVGTGAVGAAYQGQSVSISADGNTAIVGGNGANYYDGAAWVYTRSGSTWTQQGNLLFGTGAIGNAQQGYSVSLSADGNTAIVGGVYDNNSVGAAWVYTRTDTTWTQQGNKLVGTGAVGGSSQGTSVSLSADGNTAIVGGYFDNGGLGAAWVYTRNSGTWTQQGNKLVGSGATYAYQGQSVSLSADGNTVMVGGYFDEGGGSVWMFTRSGGIWTQQGNKIVGTGAVMGGSSSYQGFSVALSADGNTGIVGGYRDNSYEGAVWVYTRTGGIWSQKGNKLVGSGAVSGAYQGYSVSLSADGTVGMVGGIGDNFGTGAAWVYIALLPPTITSFTPTSANTGATITITGTNFTGATAVSFGGTASTSFTVVNATTITAIVGSGTSGIVSVTTAGGTASLAGFVYLIPPTITSFTPTTATTGATITITGTNFTGATAVSFGGTAANSFRIVNATSITAIVGSGASGSVSVTTAGSTASLAGFVYLPPPTITSFTPTTATTGATITITGTNFTGATAVSFGGTAATSFTVVNAITITAIVGSGASGNVSVTTAVSTAALPGFVFALPPTISSFTPANGCTGTSVTITGTNFTGATAVSFGGTAAASFIVNSATSITAVVGTGSTGTISVTTPVAAATSFTNFYIGTATAFAYVANSNSNNVSVINTTTNTVTTTVAVGTYPYGVSVTPDGTKAYVANNASHNVSVINVASNTVTATVAVGNYPASISVTPDGTKAYVANNGSSNVSVINLINNTVIATVAVGTYPVGVSVSPDGSKIYVANELSNSVSVINTASNTVTATVTVGASPKGIGVSPDGSKVYVSNLNSNTVSVINTTSNSVAATIAMGSIPYGLSISPDGSKVYVANNGSNNVSVINTVSNTIIATIAVGTNPIGVSVSPDGSKVYVANSGSNNVSVIKTGSNTVIATVAVGTLSSSLGNFIANVVTPCVSPTIISFSPTTAGSGTTVTITGTNFTGATAVSFGGTAATSFTVVNATTITAVVAAGASGIVSVTTAGGMASLAGFVFALPPTVSSFTPTTATTGDTVTIKGTNFTGASAVSFGSTPANSFVVINDTVVKAVVAVGTARNVNLATAGTVSVTTGGGTASLAGFTYCVAVTPTVSVAASATTICAGTSVTFTATLNNGGTTPTYQWKRNGINVGTNSATYTNATLANKDTITCIMTSNASCISTSTAISAKVGIKVNALPTATITATGSLTFCSGDSVLLSATAASNRSYQWIKGSTNISSAVNSTYYAKASGSYKVKITNTNTGCNKTSSSKTVTVYALPTVASITGTNTICKGSTSQLSNTTIGGTWSSSDTLIATISNTGLVIGNLVGPSTITYTTAPNANGCINRATALISVKTLPSISGTISGTKTVCAGKTTQLTNTTAGGNWSSSDNNTATVSSTGLVTGVAAGTVTITYTTAPNASGCVNKTSVSVSVTAPCSLQPVLAKSIVPVEEIKSASLEVSIFPNPTGNVFNVHVKAPKQESITIRVIDVNGKIHFSAKGMPGQVFHFGEQLKAGTYLVEVKQREEAKTVKAVKVRQ